MTIEGFRCPYMDRLGRQLIDAYRDSEDSGTPPKVNSSIEELHHQLADHRIRCPLCLELRLSSQKIIVGASLDAVISHSATLQFPSLKNGIVG